LVALLPGIYPLVAFR